MVKSVSEFRKAEIVDAASKALIENGLGHFSYDIIALEAGTSRQLIRHYYPNPEDLMVDLCHGLSAWYVNYFESEISKLKDAEHLPHILDFYFGLTSINSQGKPKDDLIIDALVALSADSEKIKSSLLDHFVTLKDQLANTIEASHPSIKPKQRDQLGFQITCLIYGYWKMVASLNFSEVNNKISRAAVDRLIKAHL